MASPSARKNSTGLRNFVSGLHQCIDEKRYKQFRYLLRAQTAFRDARDTDGLTPLLRCCALDDENLAISLVRRLLDCGAKATLRDRAGLTALHYACKLGRYRLARMLLQRVLELSVSDVDAQGNSALHYAVLAGDPDLLGLILGRCNREGVSVDKRNALGFSPLLLAASNGQSEAARRLMEECGASPSMRDDVYFLSAPEWLAIRRSKGEGGSGAVGSGTDGVQGKDGGRERSRNASSRCRQAPRDGSGSGGAGGVVGLMAPEPAASAAASSAPRRGRHGWGSCGGASRPSPPKSGCAVRQRPPGWPRRPATEGERSPSPASFAETARRQEEMTISVATCPPYAAAEAAGGARQDAGPAALGAADAPTSWQMLHDWTLVLYKQLSPSYRRPAAPALPKGELRRPTVLPAKTGQRQKNAAGVAAACDSLGDEAKQAPTKVRANAMYNMASHFRLQLPAEAASEYHFAKGGP